ncbi:MAG TPA: hypothetical protein P5081_07920 [Phycisphaerae bacterium]|nr:hypothetical protein [Phycisphaerae bacterium]HRW52799.1 hypothetical protein [Phycisphaerae bacterium]
MMQESRQRLIRRLLASLALAIAAYGAWFGYTRITYRPESRVAYWEAKLRELNPERPGMVPFDQVRPMLLRAEQWAVDCPDAANHKTTLEFIGRGNWDPTSNPEVACARSLLTSEPFASEFAALREAIQSAWVVPPCLSDSGETDTWTGRWAARDILIAYSRFAREELHDSQAQLAAWRDALKFARIYADSRTYFGCGFAMSCRSRVAVEIARSVSEIPGDERIPFINELMVPTSELSLRPSQRIAGHVIAERCEFDRIFVKDGGWLDVAFAHERYVNWHSKRSRLWNLTAPIFMSREETESRFVRELAKLDQCPSLVALGNAFPYERSQDYEASLLLLRVMHYAWFDNFADLIRLQYISDTLCEGAACMIALHNYRIDHGAYPATLELLVPAYMPRLPIDFGDGNSLRYHPIEGDYLLYSVGSDGVDDGGTPYDVDSKGEGEWRSTGTDVVINVGRRPYR